MKRKKVRYTDEPMEFRVIPDFLPPPSELIFKEEKEKITLSLNKRSVDFFRREAKKHDVGYQTMIRRLLDKYASQFEKR